MQTQPCHLCSKYVSQMAPHGPKDQIMLAIFWFPKHTSDLLHMLSYLPDTDFWHFPNLSLPYHASTWTHTPQQSWTCTPALPALTLPTPIELIIIVSPSADTFTSMVFTPSCNYTFIWIIISLHKLFNDLWMQECILMFPALNTEPVMKTFVEGRKTWMHWKAF